LRSDDVEVLINAVAILGVMKARQTQQLMEPLVDHPDERVRLAVIDTLGNIKQPESIVKYMTDSSQEARIKALRMLGKLKYPQVYPVLLDRIKSKNFLNLEFAEQREYFNYLAVNADHNLVPIMKNILFKRKWFGRKKYRVMRRLAAITLGQIGSEKALEILRKGMEKRNKEIQAACDTALKGMAT
jgi:HEAT repeat protein